MLQPPPPKKRTGENIANLSDTQNPIDAQNMRVVT